MIVALLQTFAKPRGIGALFLAVFSAVLPTTAQVSREADLKAALLLNLSQFVDWPTNAFATPESPIVIAVVGRDGFGRTLDDLVRPVTVKGRRLVVERHTSLQSLQTAHILYVASNRESGWPEVQRATHDRPMLTVADFPDFARRGGMVELYRNSEDKLRLRVNLTAARAAGLTLSSKLLRVSEVIETRGSQ